MSIMPIQNQLEPEQKRLAYITNWRLASIQHHKGVYDQMQYWYNAFNGIINTKAASFRNNLGLPFVFSIIMSDVAKKSNSIFSTWPYVSFRGFPKGHEYYAKKCEQLVSAQLLAAKSFSKSVDFFIMSDLYGTAIAQVGWTHLTRMSRRRQRDAFGQMQVVPYEYEVFNGPDWEVVDPLYFRPEPFKRRIPEMSGCIREYERDLDYLIDLNRSAGGQLYSDSALTQLKAMGDSAAQQNNIFPFARVSPFLPSNAVAVDSGPGAKSKKIQIWEWYGDLPSELYGSGEPRRRAITIANGTVILRDDILKEVFWHDQLPFVAYSAMPDPHNFFGIGKARVVEPLQDVAARLNNQKLDALDLAINPMWFANMAAIQGQQNLFTKPGRIFPVKGNPSEVVMPIVPNLSGVQLSYQEHEHLWRLAQQSSGITEDTVMGLSSSGRQTAREYMGRAESVLSRLNLEALLASSEFVEPLAEMIRDLNMQKLPIPYQMQILGDAAMINPITGLPMPMEDVMVDENVLNNSWKARAVGPSMMLTRTMQQQNSMQLLQVMSSNPVLLQATNWVNFARYIYDLFDIPADQFLVEQVPEVTQMANQLGMSPEQLLGAADNPAAAGAQGGAGGQQLELLNPEMFGMQPDAPLGMGP